MNALIDYANSIIPFSLSPWEALNRACSLHDGFADCDKEKRRAFIDFEGDEFTVSLNNENLWELL